MRLPGRYLLGVLGHRDLGPFFAAQGLDAAAIGVAGVALPWLVLSDGHSAAVAGLIYPLTIVPYLIFGLLAGSVGERMPWRRVILASHAAQTAASAVIPIWAVFGNPPLALIFASAFTVGSGRVFADAAAFTAVSSVVGPSEFVRGQSALSAIWSVGLLAGPALGGALIAAVGPAFALAAEAAALFCAALLIATVRSRSQATPHAAKTRRDLRAGLRFIRNDRAVRAFTLTNIGFAFATAGAYALQVPLLRDVIGLSSTTTGWVLAIGALVGTATSLATSPISRRIGSAAACIGAMAVAAVALGILAAAPEAATAVIAITIYTGLWWLLSTLFIGERQRRAPGELQARVGIAGRMLLLGALTAGSLLASALTSAIGIRGVYALMSLAAITATLAFGPALRRRTRPARNP